MGDFCWDEFSALKQVGFDGYMRDLEVFMLPEGGYERDHRRVGDISRRRGKEFEQLEARSLEFLKDKAAQHGLIYGAGNDGRKKTRSYGLAAKNLEETVAFIPGILGFEWLGCTAAGRTPIKFLRNGGLNYEIFSQPGNGSGAGGKVDHVSYNPDDIEEDYRWFMENGYECTTDGIGEALDGAWGKGLPLF